MDVCDADERGDAGSLSLPVHAMLEKYSLSAGTLHLQCQSQWRCICCVETHLLFALGSTVVVLVATGLLSEGPPMLGAIVAHAHGEVVLKPLVLMDKKRLSSM